MDPDKVWHDLCDLADDVTMGRLDYGVHGSAELCADGMAELIVSLRDWMANGGFPPAAFMAWTKGK